MFSLHSLNTHTLPSSRSLSPPRALRLAFKSCSFFLFLFYIVIIFCYNSICCRCAILLNIQTYIYSNLARTCENTHKGWAYKCVCVCVCCLVCKVNLPFVYSMNLKYLCSLSLAFKFHKFAYAWRIFNRHAPSLRAFWYYK